jgi:hypothetical protein
MKLVNFISGKKFQRKKPDGKPKNRLVDETGNDASILLNTKNWCAALKHSSD